MNKLCVQLHRVVCPSVSFAEGGWGLFSQMVVVWSDTGFLQTRIMELEGRVRRAAAERGAVELKKNEFQGELEKQREQLNKIQSSHNFQMESVNKLYQDEKARPALLSNEFCSA